ncbi:unnamed protein product [Brassica rapa]|uniref:Uncharacterized protein n=2 Tax=Brassica TaxID=3705 RepID=A0A3P5YL93_BRACM|nr:unnamed protein product [Brassica napus]CAG7862645.1 unnamed protein product [Brassica rapa]VDC60818.1 unnamed protein product [Brassica rapa]
MSVRQWFTELVLVNTIGAHNVDRYLEPVQEEVDKKVVLTIPKINCKEEEGIGRDKNQYSITIVDKNQLINN